MNARRLVWMAGLLAAACGGAPASVTTLTPGAAPAPRSVRARAAQLPVRQDLSSKWGVEVLPTRSSADGYMLDFRYRVRDAAKAAPLFDAEEKPMLVHQESGARFAVPVPPKVGPMRSTEPPIEGRTYFIFFGNPGRYVKSGDLVTVVVGDFHAENLVVE